MLAAWKDACFLLFPCFSLGKTPATGSGTSLEKLDHLIFYFGLFGFDRFKIIKGSQI
jgi:hypothetical protein